MSPSLKAFPRPANLGSILLLLVFFGCSGEASDADSPRGEQAGGSGGGEPAPSSGGAAPEGSGGSPLGSGGTSVPGAGGLGLPGVGGDGFSGGSGGMAPGTGGTTSGGAGSGGDGSGGAGSGGDGSGGDGSGGAMPEPGPLFPAPGSTQVCPDPSLRLRFDAPPTLGSSGSLRVYDASNSASPVVTINMGTNQITDTVGGSVFNLPRPAFVHDNEAIFVLPAAGLSYGKSYYVTMDAGVVSGPDGPLPSVVDPSEWSFTTASAAPADRSELRVSVDGTGQFCTVQGAISAADPGAIISLASGAYYGIVYFKDKDGLSIVGDDRETTIIAGVNNNNLNPSTRGRALVGLENVSDLLIESLTIENQTPQGGSQAEALAMLSCDQCIVRDATVRSLQDTLLWSGKIYAEDCLIEGNVDYIWGSGTAYFNRCEIKTVGRKGYNLQARNGSNYGYVFVDSKLTADPGITDDILARIDVTQYPSSHVAYIDCEMGPHIAPQGWSITGGGSTANLRFWEYKSRTPQGALVNTSSRAAGSRQLSDAEAAEMRDPTFVLGGWNPLP